MTTQHWRAADSALIRRVALGDLIALYHRPSGQTHVLAEPSPQILDALADEPLSTAALLQSLGADEADRPALEARLTELAEAGLIAPA